MESNSEGTARTGTRKYVRIDRSQGRFCQLMVDDLIGAEHPARMIWEIISRLDFSSFEKQIRSFENEGGRAAWSPQLLASVWTYGYTLGTSSARQLERMMEHEPGLRWLTGMETINHHTLSDFRREDAERLKGILTQVLALLSQEGLVDFQTLLQDGTKIKAQASRNSMRRRQTVSEHLEQAKACVAELDRRAAQEESHPNRSKKESAQQLSARERLARMQHAMQEMEARQAAVPPSKADQVRVSESEPEARKMKHPDGSFHPSYNVQLITEGKNGFIAGWTVSAAPNDLEQLEPGIEFATECTGQKAQTVIADGGYVSRKNIETLSKDGVVFVAPWKEEESRQAGALAKAGIALEFAAGRFARSADGKSLRCPAGAVLVQIGTGTHHGQPVQRFQAEAAACGRCPHKPQCSPNRDARLVEKVIESEAVKQHLRRMEELEIKRLYAKRKRIAEYPFLRMKWNWRHERFRLRGLANAVKESFWMVLAFTMDRWHWLRSRTGAEFNAVSTAA
jgi:transposase